MENLKKDSIYTKELRREVEDTVARIETKIEEQQRQALRIEETLKLLVASFPQSQPPVARSVDPLQPLGYLQQAATQSAGQPAINYSLYGRHRPAPPLASSNGASQSPASPATEQEQGGSPAHQSRLRL
eukprot:6185804-Pleurochrysis_carterae.AAC.3